MRISHVLADGTELSDITNHVVKVNEANAFYEKLHSIRKRLTESKPEIISTGIK